MNRKLIMIVLITVSILISLKTSQVYSGENVLSWEVYFSPQGGCTEAIINQLDKAKTSVLIQAYEFTLDPIAQALLRAHMRGVKIQVIFDNKRKNTQNSCAPFLLSSGIVVKVDSSHAAAHSKVMIIDGETVITGSFNFTRSAENKNAENLLILHNKELAGRYVKNWEDHNQHSRPFTP